MTNNHAIRNNHAVRRVLGEKITAAHHGAQRSLKSVFYTTAVASISSVLCFMPQLSFAGEAEETSVIMLEEITVTARKISENLQRVPVAVTSFGGTELGRQGIEDITELQQRLPNTTLQVSRGTNSTLTAYVRGIGQQDPLWGFEPGVGIYIDGVYIARPQGAVLDVLDVERIEVLRGPQGTLYGKNTIGGAVKYETKRLSGDPSFYLEGRYGSYNQMDAKITGQLPVVADKLFFGFGGATLNRDGFGSFLSQGNKENYNKSLLTGRLKLEFHPTENFFMRLSGDITQDNSNSKGGHRLTPSLITGEPVLDNVFDTAAGADVDSKVRTRGLSLHMEWQMSDHWTAKSISAYRSGDSDGVIDFDNTALSSADVAGFYEDHQSSQELQFSYIGEKLKAVSGLYYYDGESCGQFNLLLGLAPPIGLTLENSGCVDTRSYAIYAQGTYYVTDKLSVTLGGRYTRDEKEADVFQGIFLGLKMMNDEGLLILPNSDFVNDHAWSRFSPHVGVEYQAQDDLLLYASYKNGFKSGGIDMRANQRLLASANEPYNPEIVDAFEIGLKSEVWDSRLRLNLAGFYNKYKEQQITVQRVTDTGLELVSQVINAGRSEMKGLELEAVAAVTADLSLTMTVGFIDADFTKGAFFDPNLGEVVDISENFVVSNTPEWSSNVGFSYRREVADWMMNVVGNWAWRSSIHIFEIPSQLDTPGYGLVNLGVTFTSPEDKWNIGLHGKNIFDKEHRIAGYNFAAETGGLGGEDVVIGYYGDPATVTLTVGLKF